MKMKNAIIVSMGFLLSHLKNIPNYFDDDTIMYILKSDLDGLDSIEYIDPLVRIMLKDFPENIQVFRNKNFYTKINEEQVDDIDVLLKTSLYLKACGKYNKVSVLTNHMKTIYCLLVYGINVIHSVNINLDSSKIIESNEVKDTIYDTCYLLSSMSMDEIYNNFPKIIYTCVLEEVIKKYLKNTSIKDLFYILVDCIQDDKFKVFLRISNFQSYPLSGFIWNDSIILAEILQIPDYRNTIILKTGDKDMIKESYYMLNINIKACFNKHIYKEDDDCFLDIEILKYKKKCYISDNDKKNISFDFLYPSNKIEWRHPKYINKRKFYEIKLNDLILVENKYLYRLVNLKGYNYNFRFEKTIT